MNRMGGLYQIKIGLHATKIFDWSINALAATKVNCWEAVVNSLKSGEGKSAKKAGASCKLRHVGSAFMEPGANFKQTGLAANKDMKLGVNF